MAEITTEAIEAAMARVAMVAAKKVATVENATAQMVAAVVKVAFTGTEEVAIAEAMVENKVITRGPITLVYQVEVQAHLIILNRNLQVLILVCTFINFEDISPLHIYDLKNNPNISLKLLVFGIN